MCLEVELWKFIKIWFQFWNSYVIIIGICIDAQAGEYAGRFQSIAETHTEALVNPCRRVWCIAV
jgi:hypothetical protein